MPFEHAYGPPRPGGMTLGELRGWVHGMLIARHRVAGGEYDDETDTFVPIKVPTESE